MTCVEIIDLFTLYGVDIVVLGAMTSAITQLLKTTALKNVANKIYTFLPFAIGTALYICYSAITHTDFCFPFENIFATLEKGISVGAAATLVYVVYEQSVRGKRSDMPQSLIEALVVNFVDSDRAPSTAEKIREQFDAADIAASAQKIAAAIAENAAEDADKDQIAALALLIAETLKQTTDTP